MKKLSFKKKSVNDEIITNEPRPVKDRSIKHIFKMNFLPITFLLYSVVIIAVVLLFMGGNTDEVDTVGTVGQDDELSNLGWTNTEYGIGLNPPSGWTVVENDAFGAIVRFNGPEVDGFTANVGINGPSALEEGDTLSSQIDAVLELYPGLFTDFSLIARNERTINGLSGYEIVYTFSQGTSDIKQKQVLTEKNGIVFTFTYSAEMESYGTYLSNFEQSISSFTIT